MLSVSNLTKAFYHRPVLNRIDFTVDAGEIVGLLGKNGAGKSTLLRILGGLSASDHGLIKVNDEHLKSGNIAARIPTLYLGHAPGLYPSLSALENLSYAHRLYGLSPNLKAMQTTLSKVGLDRQHDDAIKVYSFGMLQRLKLALALSLPWSILLFDEPFSGLDTQGRELTRSVLDEWKQNQRTMIIVVHDVDWALSFCSRIIALGDAQIAVDAGLDDTSRPEIRKKVRELIG